MDRTSEKPESESRKLSLKKETLQHLKVRTNLKGGVAQVAEATFDCGTHVR